MLKSLDSYEFKATLIDFFKGKPEESKVAKVDWDTWFFKPGMPPKPPFDDSMSKVCIQLADKWISHSQGDTSLNPKKSDIEGWIANQSVVFLEALQTDASKLTLDDCRLLNKTYGFAESQNVEVSSRSFMLSLMKRDTDVFEGTAELLGRVGRMKFVRPLYRELKACDKAFAISVFEKNRAFYHPICRSQVEKDLYGDK
jgi:leukotriene-A4 hydrolase